MKCKRFHHGNLRAEVLNAAMDILNKQGVDKISLRSIAQDLEVSPSAPYRHFKTKNDLILALVKEGIHSMLTVFDVANITFDSNEARLQHVCMAYLLYAEHAPNLFKLLVNHDFERSLTPYADPELQHDFAFLKFQELIAELNTKKNHPKNLKN